MTRGGMQLGSILVCTLGLLFSSTTAKAAGLRVEDEQLDLGKVMAGSIAVGTFVFHNDGDRDITILQAKPS